MSKSNIYAISTSFGDFENNIKQKGCRLNIQIKPLGRAWESRTWPRKWPRFKDVAQDTAQNMASDLPQCVTRDTAQEICLQVWPVN